MIRKLTTRRFFDTELAHGERIECTLTPCVKGDPIKIFFVDNRWGKLIITCSYQRAS